MGCAGLLRPTPFKDELEVEVPQRTVTHSQRDGADISLEPFDERIRSHPSPVNHMSQGQWDGLHQKGPVALQLRTPTPKTVGLGKASTRVAEKSTLSTMINDSSSDQPPPFLS
jgi:hypothetical protein